MHEFNGEPDKLKDMNYTSIRFERQDQIGIMTLNRPESLNALNSVFFREAGLLFDELESKSLIKLLIITGEGKAFAAGADIAEMADMTQEQGMEFSRNGQDFFNRIENASFPVIAAVNGFALGGGCELAMACDFRFSSEKAKFGQPEVNLGMIPGFAGTQRLARLVGSGTALYLLYTASIIDAEEAYRIGLVQKVFQHDWLLDETIATARIILSKGPESIKKVKKVTRKGLNLDFASGCLLETKEFGSQFEHEGAEGMKAFLEKRTPHWHK
jgi:enoyl-CoA hydratase